MISYHNLVRFLGNLIWISYLNKIKWKFKLTNCRNFFYSETVVITKVDWRWLPGAQERSSSRQVTCQRMLIVDSSVTLNVHHRDVELCFYRDIQGTQTRKITAEAAACSASRSVSHLKEELIIISFRCFTTNALVIISELDSYKNFIICNVCSFWYLDYHNSWSFFYA